MMGFLNILNKIKGRLQQSTLWELWLLALILVTVLGLTVQPAHKSRVALTSDMNSQARSDIYGIGKDSNSANGTIEQGF